MKGNANRASPSVALNDAQYLGCLRCGLCVPSCPIYKESLVESDSPRGRIALVKAVEEGVLELSARYADRMQRCTLCAACAEICPSGIQVEELLLGAREKLAQQGLLSLAAQRLAESLLSLHNISGEDSERRLIWTENMAQPPLGRGRKQARLVYFVGCVSSYFPASYSIPQSLVRIMEKTGQEYALLGDEEWCCGYPLLASGLSMQAEELMAHNLAQVRALGADTLLATCPSCYYMWHTIYPAVLGETGIRVLHATAWLEELLAVQQLALRPLPARATYHDPCDLGRKSGLYEPPRRVLQAIPGLKLVEMTDQRANALCCGGGGNLESHNAELTSRLAERRLRQAGEVGAEWLLSACQQCKRTLSGAAKRQVKTGGQRRVRVLDIVELVDQQLGE